MKKLITLFALLACASCTHTDFVSSMTPVDPPAPACNGEVVGRMMIMDKSTSPPTIIHGVLFDDDCDPETPAIFVPDEDFPGQGKPFQDE